MVRPGRMSRTLASFQGRITLQQDKCLVQRRQLDDAITSMVLNIHGGRHDSLDTLSTLAHRPCRGSTARVGKLAGQAVNDRALAVGLPPCGTP